MSNEPEELDRTRPQIIIHMDGGIIQDVTASQLVNILVIDYDIDGLDAESITEVDQGDGKVEDAYCFMQRVDVDDGEYTRQRFEKFFSTDGKEC